MSLHEFLIISNEFSYNFFHECLLISNEFLKYTTHFMKPPFTCSILGSSQRQLMQREKLSGAQYRKRRAEKAAVKEQQRGSIMKFLKPSSQSEIAGGEAVDSVQ